MRKWNKHMCITSWTEKKWMEWSLFYTETQSTAGVFEGNLQTLNWKNESLMLKSGLMRSVAETWGKNKNTEYWHENENFTSAMYTCHIFETDPSFLSADDMKWARKAFRERRPPPSRSLLLPLGKILRSFDHLCCLSLFLHKVRHFGTFDIVSYPGKASSHYCFLEFTFF